MSNWISWISRQYWIFFLVWQVTFIQYWKLQGFSLDGRYLSYVKFTLFFTFPNKDVWISSSISYWLLDFVTSNVPQCINNYHDEYFWVTFGPFEQHFWGPVVSLAKIVNFYLILYFLGFPHFFKYNPIFSDLIIDVTVIRGNVCWFIAFDE